MEDDVCFIADFIKHVRGFLKAVPSDWDQLMLGGQHLKESVLVKPGVRLCTDCERMHCYAIRGEFMKRLYQRLSGGGKFNGNGHCDWILGRDPELQVAHKVYAPEFFIAGQERNKSDIAGGIQPRKFWNPPGPDLCVVNLHAPQSVAFDLRQYGFFLGNRFDRKDRQVKIALNDIFRKTENDLPARIQALSDWIKLMQWELAADPVFICTIWHPQATPELVKAASLWKVYEVTASTVQDALRQLPRRLRGPLARSHAA